MIIKASSITHLTDARFFAGYGVSYMGFCFDPQSPDYISPQQALAIKGWLHGVQIVAEFANQDAENIQGISNFFQPDIIELPSQDILLLSGEIRLPVIVKTSMQNISQVQQGKYKFVLIADYAGEKIPLIESPVMIGLTESSVMFTDPGINGFEIKGTPEQEVGLKNYDTIAALLDQLLEM